MSLSSTPPQLIRLAESIGERIEGAESITGLGRQTGAETHRLICVDGRCFKGRRLSPTISVDENVKLRNCCDPHVFSRVVAVDDPWMLEEWIAGDSLTRSSVDLHHVESCGKILAQLHATALPQVGVPRPRNVEQRLMRCESEMRYLVERNILSEAQEKEIRSHVRANRPGSSSPPTIIHRDFCPENIVIQSDGRLVVVDNATICVGVVEEDLARTWQQWPMSGNDWAHFVKGYSRDTDLASFLRHFRFWAATCLVRSAHYRSWVDSELVGVPIERLRRQLNEWKRGRMVPGQLCVVPSTLIDSG